MVVQMGLLNNKKSKLMQCHLYDILWDESVPLGFGSRATFITIGNLDPVHGITPPVSLFQTTPLTKNQNLFLPLPLASYFLIFFYHPLYFYFSLFPSLHTKYLFLFSPLCILIDTFPTFTFQPYSINSLSSIS